MQTADYIKPVEFNKLLDSAKKLASRVFDKLWVLEDLASQKKEAKYANVRSCNSVGFYNMLQETKENEVCHIRNLVTTGPRSHSDWLPLSRRFW